MPKHRLFSLGARLPDDDLDASDLMARARPIYRQFQTDIAAIFGADAVRDESQTIVTRGPRLPAATAAATPPPVAPASDPAGAPHAAEAPAEPQPDATPAPEPHTKHGRRAA